MNGGAEGRARTDEVNAAKDKGNALLSYLLNCVRRGRRSDIEAALSDPGYPRLIQLTIGDDLSFAHKVFQYLSPQILRAAMDGGMSWMAAAGAYHDYARRAQRARSAWELLELHKQMLLECADNVAHEQDCCFSPLVRRCRTYVRQHLDQPLSVRHLAEVLHCSRGYLSRVYKRETGETISSFVRREKISEAKLLLQHSSLSLADIGQQLGYCSQSHFAHVFRKETGMTPGQFRNGRVRQGRMHYPRDCGD